MAKRKKYTKLPNGYGSIRYLGKGRRNPYAVHPPATIEEGTGNILRDKPLCYVDSWYKGFAVLTAYKAGTYKPGMELELDDGDSSIDKLANKILADYNRMQGIVDKNITFAKVYEEFFDYKYNSGKEYSRQSFDSTRSAFKNCAALHDKIFANLRYNELQQVVDDCPLKHSSLENIIALLNQMYRYALIQEYVDKNYATGVKIKIADDDEHGVPFNDADLVKLWTLKDDPTAEFLLIMCYSGYRISEYKTIEINLDERYFKGGIKTTASKNRIVPIHSAIYPLVVKRLERDGAMLAVRDGTFRKSMYAFLEHHNISKHTPHDCRHTFSTLCEKYGVRNNDRKRMMGHAFNDITDDVYGHRNLEDLRTEIEKILLPICD